MNFDLLHAGTNNRYVDGDDIRLDNLGPIALFKIHKLATSSGKHLEEINHAHIICLLYKLIASSKGSDDLSVGFHRDCARRQRELTNNKNIKRKYHVTNMLDDIFGFCENQPKATCGLGYRLTLTTNSDNAVLNKGNAINNAKIKISSTDWYVKNYTPSNEQQRILIKQIVDKTPTKLHYPQRSNFMKEVTTQNLWIFERGTQEGINVLIWILIVFQQNDRQNDQNLNKDTFFRTPVVSAQCIIGNRKYPDVGILLNYCDDDYSQGYHQIKEALKALREYDTLQTYKSQNDFRSSNDGDDVGYNTHAFDIRYQKNFESARPIKVEFKIDGVVPAGMNGYVLIFEKRLASINSDGQRMFDLN